MNINPLNTFINNNSDNKDCILFYYIKYKQNHENILYWLKQLDVNTIGDDLSNIILCYLCRYSNISLIDYWINKLGINNIGSCSIELNDNNVDKYYFTNAIASHNFSKILYLCNKTKQNFWNLFAKSIDTHCNTYHLEQYIIEPIFSLNYNILKKTILTIKVPNEIKYYIFTRIFIYIIKYTDLDDIVYDFVFNLNKNNRIFKDCFVFICIQYKKYHLCKRIFKEQKNNIILKDWITPLLTMNFFKSFFDNMNNSNNTIGIFCILIKYYKETNFDIKQLLSVDNILRLSCISNSKKAFRYINKYISDYDSINDYYNYTPLIDCARYGYLDTFKYLYGKINNKYTKTLCQHKLNILSAACYNNDLRILKFILDNYNPALEIDIVKCLYGITKERYGTSYSNLIFKKIVLIDKYIDLGPYLVFILYYICGVENNETIYLKLINYFEKRNIFDTIPLERIESPKIHNTTILNFHQLPIKYVYNLLIKNNHLEFILKYSTKLYNESKSTSIFIINILMSLKYNIPDWKIFKILCNYIDYSIFQNRERFGIGYYFYDIICGYINDIDKIMYMNNKLKALPDYNKILKNIAYIYISKYTSKNILYLTFLIGVPFELIQQKNHTKYTQKILNTRMLLKKMVQRRFNKYRNIHKIYLDDINDTITFSPNINLINTFISNPVHIESSHILNNKFIDNNYLILSEKANGIKKEIFNKNLFPPLNCKEVTKLYCEYMEDLNIYMVYDVELKSSNMNIIDKYEYLIQFHPYIKYKSKTINSIEDLYIYKYDIKMEFDKFCKNNKKGKILWWPKMVWKIDLNRKKLLDFLTNIMDLELGIFPTDGWIINNLITSDIYKLKPNKHLTIDLLFEHNRWLDYEKNQYNIDMPLKKYDNCIYRCYYKDNKWSAQDIRTEKKFPNKKYIIDVVNNLHKTKFKPNDLSKFINAPYYNNFQYNNNKTKNLVTKILVQVKLSENNNILDIGCGYNYFYNKRLIQRFSNYCGIDIDYNIFNKFLEEPDNISFKLADMNDNWTNDNIKYNIILITNSIHNAIILGTNGQEPDLNKNFIKQLIRHSAINSRIYISICDLDELEKINIPVIRDGVNFVKLNNNGTITYYYSWTHLKPITEPIISSELLIKIMKHYNFNVLGYINNKVKNNNLWNKYLNCFKTIEFIYK
jgi:hypothetical protein